MKELTKGTKFYKVDAFGNITSYEYLCVHPKHEGYHIVMNMMGDKPERMYHKEFDNALYSYDEAKQKAIECLEFQIKLLKES